MADFYKDIETRIAAAVQSGAVNTGLHTARQAGKSRMLAMMYGSGNATAAMRMSSPQREHPLQYVSQFKYIGRVSMWGGVALYKTNTKLTSEIICKKTKVPHTDVYYGSLDVAESVIDSNIVGLVWTRATPNEQMDTAVATMLMLGKEVVVLRAFEP